MPCRANIKVSSTETGAIFGSLVYEGAGYGDRAVVVLNDIHIDIMDYISPASCTDVQFRSMWAEFEWENKVRHARKAREQSASGLALLVSCRKAALACCSFCARHASSKHSHCRGPGQDAVLYLVADGPDGPDQRRAPAMVQSGFPPQGQVSVGTTVPRQASLPRSAGTSWQLQDLPGTLTSNLLPAVLPCGHARLGEACRGLATCAWLCRWRSTQPSQTWGGSWTT